MGNKVDAYVGSCDSEVSVLWEAIGELDRDQCHVLLSLWGIGRLTVSDAVVAAELDIDVESVWDLHDSALRMLGLHWLMSHPLGTAYRDASEQAEAVLQAVDLPTAA